MRQMPIFDIMSHETNLYQRQSWNHSVRRTVLNGRHWSRCPRI